MKKFLFFIALLTLTEKTFCAEAQEQVTDSQKISIIFMMKDYIIQTHSIQFILYRLKTDLLKSYPNIWDQFVRKLQDPTYNCENAGSLKVRWNVLEREHSDIIDPVKNFFMSLDKNDRNFDNNCRKLLTEFSRTTEYKLVAFAMSIYDVKRDSYLELFNKLNNNFYNLQQNTIKDFAEQEVDLTNRNFLELLTAIFKRCKDHYLKQKNKGVVEKNKHIAICYEE